MDRVDGNFIHNRFKVSQIGETGLVLGGYPWNEKDFIQLQQAGVKTIINMMTDEEMAFREIKLEQI